MKNVYFKEPHASQLDEAREEARIKQPTHRLTYDCFEAKVRGEKVYCDKGYPLCGKRGETIGLISVLRGYSSGNCKSCPNFNGEPVEVI